MAITVTEIAGAGLANGTANANVAGTVAASQAVLIAGIGLWITGGSPPFGPTILWNTTEGLSEIIGLDTAGTNRETGLWLRAAPTAATANLGIATAETCERTLAYITATEIETAARATATNATSGANPTLAVTTVAGDLAVAVFQWYNRVPSGITGDADDFMLQDEGGSFDNVAIVWGIAGDTTTDLGLTMASGEWSGVIASFAPVAAGGSAGALGGLAGGGFLAGPGGLVGRGGGLVARGMTKVNGIWQQTKAIVRPRLIVPVGISLAGAR